MNKSNQLSKASASARTTRVFDRVRQAMESMEREIGENDGLYIFGRLSLAEVCRRAGVHPITMQGPAHSTTTKPMALAWLERMKRTTATGKRAVRAKVTRRARDAETELRELAANFQLRENEIPRLVEEIARLTERIEKLNAENLRLQAIVSEGRVIPMRKKQR